MIRILTEAVSVAEIFDASSRRSSGHLARIVGEFKVMFINDNEKQLSIAWPGPAALYQHEEDTHGRNEARVSKQYNLVRRKRRARV
jgi:hypothetical protein